MQGGGGGAEAYVSGEARFDLTSTLTSSESTATIIMCIFMNFYHYTQGKSKL